MKNEHAIALNNIRRSYGPTNALVGVHLQVPYGSLYGLIGADGAGKSTLLQIVATLLRPDTGFGFVLENPLAAGRDLIRSQIGWMSQKFSLYPDLTVIENLKFTASLFGIKGKAAQRACDELLHFTRLQFAADRRAGRLSGGMKQKLALACALIHKPRLLLLDEPTVGVDPVTRRDFWELLAKLKSDGLTTLVSTPYMDEASRCDKLTLLHQGEILGKGTPSELCAQVNENSILVQISGDSRLNWPTQKLAISPFVRLYSASGSIRGAIQVNVPLAEALEAIRQVIPDANEIHALTPTVEDYLMAMLMNAKGN